MDMDGMKYGMKEIVWSGLWLVCELGWYEQCDATGRWTATEVRCSILHWHHPHHHITSINVAAPLLPLAISCQPVLHVSSLPLSVFMHN